MNFAKLIVYVISAYLVWIPSSGQEILDRVDRRFGVSGRIIGGDPARAGQFPFAAAIYITTDTGRFFCGGALISNRWILTAGHCIYGGISFSIRVGSNTLNSNDFNRVTLTATTSVIHPDYNGTTLQNDIGLIQLNEPVTFTDYISSIFLPATDLQHDASVISIGWGQTGDYDQGPVDHLNYVNTVTLPDEACKLIYGDQIAENMFCVEGEYNQGTCLGDMGTPLVRYVLNDRHAEHVGVSSFLSGNGCESTDPSGYTKTFGYLQWIRNVTGIE